MELAPPPPEAAPPSPAGRQDIFEHGVSMAAPVRPPSREEIRRMLQPILDAAVAGVGEHLGEGLQACRAGLRQV